MDKKTVINWIRQVRKRLKDKEPGYDINKMPTLKKHNDGGDLQALIDHINRIKSEGVFSNTTDVPNADELIKGPRQGRKGELVKMSPMEYMERTAKGFKQPLDKYLTSFNSEMVADYADDMYKGDKFPLTFLDYSRGRFAQEGRHRTYAAHILGIKEIPVLIINDADDYKEPEVEPEVDKPQDPNAPLGAGDVELFKMLGIDESVNKKIVRLFLEASAREYWYHGEPNEEERSSFRDQRMDRDPMTDRANENVAGPGIYFTDDKGEAAKYMKGQGNLYTVTLRGDIIDEKTDLTEEMIRKLINWAPHDYMERMEEEMEEDEEGSFHAYIEKTVARYAGFGKKNFLPPAVGIYEKFYKHEQGGAEDFTRGLTALGLDGIKTKPNFIDGHHVIMWNPKSISIEKVENYEELFPEDDY